ncbi:hypothetical protein Tco_0271079 [Tanacetum coccineum]
MEHHDEAGVVVFNSQAWRRLFDTWGQLVWELILEFLSTLKFGENKAWQYQDKNAFVLPIFYTGPHDRKIDDVGDVFTNLEILKCWSLETSRRLFNT